MARLPVQPVPEDEDDDEDEITEGGKPHKDKENTLQQFLAEHFGEDAPSPDDYVRSKDESTPRLLSETGDEASSNKLPSLGWIGANFKTKSAAIRYLISQGHPTNAIAELLNVRYQHVRNVKTTQLKRGPNEDWNLERRALSAKIEAEEKSKHRSK